MQRNRFMKAVATAAALAVGVVAFAGSASAQPSFTDVEGDEFYGPAVEWLEEQNLTTGYGGSDAEPSDVYEPHLTVDRAQIATFLWRMAGRPDANPSHGFTDVDDDAYYAPAVAWLRQSGVTTGVGGSDLATGTTFEPHRNVTRAEAITFLWRYGGRPGTPPPPTYPPHGFTDTTAGAFYEPALNWAKAEGLTTGYGGSHANPTDIFVPDGDLTRGEMGALIWRYAGFPAPSEQGCLAPGEWPCDDAPPPPPPPPPPAPLMVHADDIESDTAEIQYDQDVVCDDTVEAAEQFGVVDRGEDFGPLTGVEVTCDGTDVVVVVFDGDFTFTDTLVDITYEEATGDDRVRSADTDAPARSPQTLLAAFQPPFYFNVEQVGDNTAELTYTRDVTCDNSAEAAEQFMIHDDTEPERFGPLTGEAITCDGSDVVVVVFDGEIEFADEDVWVEYEEGAEDVRVHATHTGLDALSPWEAPFEGTMEVAASGGGRR